MQEAFEQKQATMFLALDKLFTLHNALLLESRLIKACFVYSIAIFILYMLTSTKSTYSVRPQLYVGKYIRFCLLKDVNAYSLLTRAGVSMIFCVRSMSYILN